MNSEFCGHLSDFYLRRGGISHAPLRYVPGMDHGTVRIVLDKVISLPSNVNLPDF
jgi:hypothetical protein